MIRLQISSRSNNRIGLKTDEKVRSDSGVHAFQKVFFFNGNWEDKLFQQTIYLKLLFPAYLSRFIANIENGSSRHFSKVLKGSLASSQENFLDYSSFLLFVVFSTVVALYLTLERYMLYCIS